MRGQAIRIAASLVSLLATVSAASATQLSGELRAWHKVTLTLDGPQASETDREYPRLLVYENGVHFIGRMIDGREFETN